MTEYAEEYELSPCEHRGVRQHLVKIFDMIEKRFLRQGMPVDSEELRQMLDQIEDHVKDARKVIWKGETKRMCRETIINGRAKMGELRKW
jgi:fructose-1-phosphate kinase PfkB-like protein